jgi:hypothetical protein
MLGLERVQYRALRVALGLMGSTPNKCLGVLSGIPQLAGRFTYFNFRYLVAAFCRLGHPLRMRLGVLGTIIFERFPEFGWTGVDESMAGKMGLCGHPIYFPRCDTSALVRGPKGGEKLFLHCVKSFICT